MSRPAIERVFLGWHAGALDRAAEWILARHGADAGKVLVALPGARASRALREKLARRAPPAWTPPRVLTQGELVDEMVVLDRPVAGRLARRWRGPPRWPGSRARASSSSPPVRPRTATCVPRSRSRRRSAGCTRTWRRKGSASSAWRAVPSARPVRATRGVSRRSRRPRSAGA
jgi:hypothetical protein